MRLNQQQKKFLKKNLKQLSLSEIAKKLSIPEEELLKYLKSIWSEQKYQKYLHLQKQIKTSSQHLQTATGLSLWFKQNYWALAFLCLLVLVVYFNSLGNEFLSDDIPTIVENENIANYGYYLKNYPLLLLRHFYLITIYKVFGLKPVFFRLGNIFFHLGSVITIYGIFSFLATPFLALSVSSIFAVHPILIEAVAWISGGIHAQYSFFLLLSFGLYLLARKKPLNKYYLFSLISFILALSSCEKAVPLPLIILVFELSKDQLSKFWKKIIPYFILSGVWAFWVLFGGAFAGKTTALRTEYYQQGGFYNPLTQVPTAITSYLKLIFWPDKLTLYHSEMLFSTGEYLIMALITLGFFGLIVYTFFKKKYRHCSFWLAFFVIALLPMLTPIKIGWIVAERYVYLGSLGIFAIAGMGIEKISHWAKSKEFGYLVLGTLLVILSIRTIIRNVDWKNQDNLWLAAGKTSPTSPQNHNNLGDLYSRRGEFEKAVVEFKTAIALLPNYGDAYHNLANTYLQMNKIDPAISNYQKALECNPRLWQSHQNLAAIFAQTGQLDLAEEHLKKALAISSNNPNLHLALAIVYQEQGKTKEAQAELQKTLEIDPTNQKAQEFLKSF